MSADVLVYDGECGFCTWWADYFARRTPLETVPYAGLTDDLRERLPEDYEDCSHLVTDDAVYSCGASAERALARTDVPPGAEDLFGFLRQFEDYERVRERLYREVADRRDGLGRILSKDEVRGTDD
jgi:predicted DCC family thiol-disulfide oxidoreductase YuxK